MVINNFKFIKMFYLAIIPKMKTICLSEDFCLSSAQAAFLLSTISKLLYCIKNCGNMLYITEWKQYVQSNGRLWFPFGLNINGFRVSCIFFLVENDKIAFTAAREHYTPKMTSIFDFSVSMYTWCMNSVAQR